MFDAIILAKEVKVEKDKTIVKLSSGVELIIPARLSVPEECEGPVMISIIKDKVNITRVAGPCTVWSTIHVEERVMPEREG